MGLDRLLGTSPAMLALKDMVSRVASAEGRVLITGENGTGKELVAQALHDLSRRAGRPFITLNCAAVPSELIESELFGHERGSFTGAHARKLGKFEAAHEGTLFLDEVGDMPTAMQAKLLRVLQTGEVVRVGATSTVMVDVRVLAATNKDLKAEVDAGRFREDLYYRLNVVPLQTPALRDRKVDIPVLVASFLADAVARNNKPTCPVLTNGALALLAGYDFPGNVRELQNLVERLVILTDGDLLDDDDVRPWMPESVKPNVELLAHLDLEPAPLPPSTRSAPPTTPTDDGAPPPHGTAQRYYSRKFRCHCEACRAAYTAYRREKRNNKRSDDAAIEFIAPALGEGVRVICEGVCATVVSDVDTDGNLLVRLDSGDDAVWSSTKVQHVDLVGPPPDSPR